MFSSSVKPNVEKEKELKELKQVYVTYIQDCELAIQSGALSNSVPKPSLVSNALLQYWKAELTSLIAQKKSVVLVYKGKTVSPLLTMKQFLP